MLFLVAIFLLLLVLYFELVYPFKRLEVQKCRPKNGNGRVKQKTFVVHVHTFYSYDSLGKLEEIERAAKRLGIDKVFVTDHNNDRVKVHQNPLIVPGIEYQDPIYGRLLKLDNRFTVMAHPNNTRKREYAWRGTFKGDFFYELIDLKDVLYESHFLLKLYMVLRFIALYPFKGLKTLDFFPKLVPIFDWLSLYLERTKGQLKVIGGLDHHVKLTFWEKPKKFLSFPPYIWSFYILPNKTFNEEFLKNLKSGDFYISFCHFELNKTGNFVTYKGKKILTFNFFNDGSFKVNSCGFIENGTVLVALFKYSFRIKDWYFGLTPLAIFQNGKLFEEDGKP